MTWSISKGTELAASGSRQYSHRPPARSRTYRRSASFTEPPELLEREAGLGLQEVEEEADLAVFGEFRLLLRPELALLSLDRQLVHPGEVGLLEGEFQEGAGGGGREVAA